MTAADILREAGIELPEVAALEEKVCKIYPYEVEYGDNDLVDAALTALAKEAVQWKEMALSWND